jgi:hypothetical protein
VEESQVSQPIALRVAAGAAAALLCLLGAACSASDPGPSSGAPSTAPVVPSTVRPVPTTTGSGQAAGRDQAGDQAGEQAAVQGELLQFRRDVPRRRLEVRLVAAGTGLVVEGLELRAPGLTVVPAPGGEVALRPAPGLDLPVTLGVTDCTVQPAAPVVSLRLRDGGGARRTVEVPLTDGGLVRRLHDEDCADQLLRGQADITVVDVEPVQVAHGPALRITVQLRRTAGSDQVRVTGTGSTTVYDITPVGPLPTLDSGTASLQLDMVPARCDVHALGESYRTGLIGLVVAVGEDAPRPFVLTPDDDVRHRLEEFAVTTCRSAPD